MSGNSVLRKDVFQKKKKARPIRDSIFLQREEKISTISDHKAIDNFKKEIKRTLEIKASVYWFYNL